MKRISEIHQGIDALVSAEIHDTYLLSPHQLERHIYSRLTVISDQLQHALADYKTAWENYLHGKNSIFDLHFDFFNFQKTLAKVILSGKLLKDGFSFLASSHLQQSVNTLKASVTCVLDAIRDGIDLIIGDDGETRIKDLCPSIVKHPSKEPGITVTLLMDQCRGRRNNMRLVREGEILLHDLGLSDQPQDPNFQQTRVLFSSGSFPPVLTGNVLLDIQEFSQGDHRLKALLSCLFTQENTGIQVILSALFFRKDQPLMDLLGNKPITTPAQTNIVVAITQSEILITCLANNLQFGTFDVATQEMQENPSYIAAFCEIAIDRDRFVITTVKNEFVTVPHEKTRPEKCLLLAEEVVTPLLDYSQQLASERRLLSNSIVAFHARHSLSMGEQLFVARDSEKVLDIIQYHAKEIESRHLISFVSDCLRDKELATLPPKKRIALRLAMIDVSPYATSFYHVQFAIYVMQHEHYRNRLTKKEFLEIYSRYQRDLQFVLTAEEEQIAKAVDDTKVAAFLCNALGYKPSNTSDALGEKNEVDFPEKIRNLLELIRRESIDQEVVDKHVVPCKTLSDVKKLILIVKDDLKAAHQFIFYMLHREKYAHIIPLIKSALVIPANAGIQRTAAPSLDSSVRWNDSLDDTVITTIRTVLRHSDDIADSLLESSVCKSLTSSEITSLAAINKSGYIAEKLLSGNYWKLFHKGFIWHPSNELQSAELKTLLITHKNSQLTAKLLAKPTKKTWFQQLLSFFGYDNDYRSRLSFQDINELFLHHIQIKEEIIPRLFATVMQKQNITAKEVLQLFANTSSFAKLLMQWAFEKDISLLHEMIKNKLIQLIENQLQQNNVTIEHLLLLADFSLSEVYKNKVKSEKTQYQLTAIISAGMARLENTIQNLAEIAQFVARTGYYQAAFIDKLEKLNYEQLQAFKEKHKDVIMQIAKVKFFAEQAEKINTLLGTDIKYERTPQEKAEFIISLGNNVAKYQQAVDKQEITDRDLIDLLGPERETGVTDQQKRALFLRLGFLRHLNNAIPKFPVLAKIIVENYNLENRSGKLHLAVNAGATPMLTVKLGDTAIIMFRDNLALFEKYCQDDETAKKNFIILKSFMDESSSDTPAAQPTSVAKIVVENPKNNIDFQTKNLTETLQDTSYYIDKS